MKSLKLKDIKKKIKAIKFPKFDFIVANIFARIHIAIAKDYQQALKDNGILIAAGFTKDYEESITAAMSEQGFTVIDCEQFNEWIAFAYRQV